MLFRFNHPELGPQVTYLIADVAVDATSSSVENNDGFTTDDYVVFGQKGEEKSELVTLSGVTGEEQLDHTTGPNFAHPQDTIVSFSRYDQIEFIKSSTDSTPDVTSDDWSVVATIDIDWDQSQTVYDYSSGSTTEYYAIRYKNSDSGSYSDYSDALPGGGWTKDSLAGMRKEVLNELEDTEAEQFSSSRINRLLIRGVKNLTKAIYQSYPDALLAYTTQSLTSGTQEYDLPTGFLGFKKVDVNFTGSGDDGYYRAVFEDITEGLPDTDYYTTDPRIYRIGSQFGIRPSDDITSSGYAKLWYYKFPTAMSDDGDTHGLPYGAEDLLIPYVLWKIWTPKDVNKANMYRVEFEDFKQEWLDALGSKFQTYQNPRLKIRGGEYIYDTKDVNW